MAGPKILILEARYYNDIADELLRGVQAVLETAGVTSRIVTIPGLYEIPAAIEYAVRAGVLGPTSLRPDNHMDGVIVLGCAIKGETDHYDHICRASVDGLADLSVKHTLAVGMGMLTVHNHEQAMERARREGLDSGGQAARACLRMIALKQELGMAAT